MNKYAKLYLQKIASDVEKEMQEMLRGVKTSLRDVESVGSYNSSMNIPNPLKTPKAPRILPHAKGYSAAPNGVQVIPNGKLIMPSQQKMIEEGENDLINYEPGNVSGPNAVVQRSVSAPSISMTGKDLYKMRNNRPDALLKSVSISENTSPVTAPSFLGAGMTGALSATRSVFNGLSSAGKDMTNRIKKDFSTVFDPFGVVGAAGRATQSFLGGSRQSVNRARAPRSFGPGERPNLFKIDPNTGEALPPPRPLY